MTFLDLLVLPYASYLSINLFYGNSESIKVQYWTMLNRSTGLLEGLGTLYSVR